MHSNYFNIRQLELKIFRKYKYLNANGLMEAICVALNTHKTCPKAAKSKLLRSDGPL